MFIHEVLCNKAFLTNVECQWLCEDDADASLHLGSITTGLNTKVLLELQGKPPLSSDVSVWIAPEACLSVKCCFNVCLLRAQTGWKACFGTLNRVKNEHEGQRSEKGGY
jgi:hypothetical protein